MNTHSVILNFLADPRHRSSVIKGASFIVPKSLKNFSNAVHTYRQITQLQNKNASTQTPSSTSQYLEPEIVSVPFASTPQVSHKPVDHPSLSSRSVLYRKMLYHRHIHGNSRKPQVLYTSPPSYKTIKRWFSSEVNLPRYISSPSQKSAKQNDQQPIDIHEISGPDPKDFDILITDVTNDILQTEIAKAIGIRYLADADPKEAQNQLQTADCILYGRNWRTIFPAAVTFGEKAIWDFFIFNTGAPLTYLSTQTCQTLGINHSNGNPERVTIGGYSHLISPTPTSSHFKDISILGVDFMVVHNVNPFYDYHRRRARLFFGNRWQAPQEK